MIWLLWQHLLFSQVVSSNTEPQCSLIQDRTILTVTTDKYTNHSRQYSVHKEPKGTSQPWSLGLSSAPVQKISLQLVSSRSEFWLNTFSSTSVQSSRVIVFLVDLAQFDHNGCTASYHNAAFLDTSRVLDPLWESILATFYTQSPVDFRGCHQHRETLISSSAFHRPEYMPKTKFRQVPNFPCHKYTHINVPQKCCAGWVLYSVLVLLLSGPLAVTTETPLQSQRIHTSISFLLWFGVLVVCFVSDCLFVWFYMF